MERVRNAWIGWMQGVVVRHVPVGNAALHRADDIGLDFAIVFAVITALLVVIPYYGAIAGRDPAGALRAHDLAGQGAGGARRLRRVQQIESNMIIPLVMSRKTRLHPAVIAIGVLVVGRLFGVVGLFVAVPIIAAVVILTEETWVKEIEDAHARRTGEGASALTLPPDSEPLLEEERSPA